MAAHASAVAVAAGAIVVAGAPAIWIGMLTFLGPLAAWLTVGRVDPFVRSHASAALSFNLSLALYLGLIIAGLRLTAGSPHTVQLVPVFLLLNMLIAFNWLAFSAIAMQRAGTGQTFTYPLTLRRPSRLVAAVRLSGGPETRSPSTKATRTRRAT